MKIRNDTRERDCQDVESGANNDQYAAKVSINSDGGAMEFGLGEADMIAFLIPTSV